MPDRVLIFGGTFDPPHRAHVELPPLVADSLGCDRILYVPAAMNPLKTDHPPTSAEHRLAMLRLAVEGVPNADIWIGELERPGPSYTIDTIEALRHELGPQISMRLLIGADQALEFHRWKDWRRIIELAEPVVMLRPPWDQAAFEAALRKRCDEAETARWMGRIAGGPLLDISATAIRGRLNAAASLDDLVPPAVAAYIREHALYGKSS